MRKIIVRFEKENDLNSFIESNGLKCINKFTKEFNISTLKKIDKKPIRTKKKTYEYWKDHWSDMPEYISNKQEPYAKIDFIFEEEGSTNLAEKLFKQNVTDKTKSLWYPKLNAGWYSTLRVVGGISETRYPVYVVSKGRSEKCYTSKFLTQMEVPHYVVVEPSEVNDYKNKLDNKYATILELDMIYKDNYDTFDKLGDAKSKGPGGTRNFCWQHSINNGFKWHWVMDDNTTEGFHYMNNNIKHKCRSGAIFRACEDFVDRYDNIAIAGLNYSKFCKMSDKTPAFVMNTRIYSYLLIRNDIPYRWRGRYNEDTDLSLRVLKDGWCTVQFNSFLAGKATTQKIKGGNTDEFYSKEGTLPKSQMLKDMHPDVTEVVWKFNRWHHQVDYKGFKQKLIYKDDYVKKQGVNNYGMFIIDTDEKGTDDTRSYLENKYVKNSFDYIILKNLII